MRAFEHAGFDELDTSLREALKAVREQDANADVGAKEAEFANDLATSFCTPVLPDNTKSANFVVVLNMGDQAQTVADQLNKVDAVCTNMTVSVTEEAGTTDTFLVRNVVGTFKPTSRFGVQIYNEEHSDCSLVSKFHLSKDVDVNKSFLFLDLVVRSCKTNAAFYSAFFQRDSTTCFQGEGGENDAARKQEVLSAVISWICHPLVRDVTALKAALRYMEKHAGDALIKRDDLQGLCGMNQDDAAWWVADLPFGDGKDTFRKQYGLAKIQQATTLALECLRPLAGVVLTLEHGGEEMFETISQGFKSAGPSDNNVNEMDEYSL